MRSFIFLKMAVSGIRKNKKLYLPYIFTCMGIITAFYIMHSLSYSPTLNAHSGGSEMSAILGFGMFVIAAFALLFLFYTNSFLVRRRYKEFGLFNILGMDKKGINRIVFWESLTVAVISLLGGIILGILFSKLAELGLIRAVKGEATYDFTLPFEAVKYTLGLFGGIFFLIMLKSLIQVRHCNPLELMKSENTGEKPPKANWIVALLGAVLLIASYIISLTIKTPLTALMLFFVAVIMVIVATYMLFMSGSVALCRLLQKNRKYYYKKEHFISVSSMAYRMKRNGAGLASICILATMALVTVSTTSSLYFGANDAIEARYPRNNEINLEMRSVNNMTDESVTKIRNKYEKVFAEYDMTPENVNEYRYVAVSGVIKGEYLNIDPAEEPFASFDDMRSIYFIDEKDYNAAMGTDISLNGNEMMISTLRCDYKNEFINVNGVELKIVGRLDKFIEIGITNVILTPTVLAVIKDYGVLEPLDHINGKNGDITLEHVFGYGYDGTDEKQMMRVYDAQTDALRELSKDENFTLSYSGGCVAYEKTDFFTTFGTLFFIGVLLSAMFIMGAAMIIYYKQVSEGHEDKKRFDIMQKVGMTKADIKKSINSQILTVFFAPLTMAGLHLAFAFPILWKLLQLFNLRNINLVITVTVCAFLGFGVLYGIIYKLTAGTYYSIVAKNED